MLEASYTYKCSICGKEIIITENDKSFPYPPEGWQDNLTQYMVEHGIKNSYTCPDHLIWEAT